MLREVQEFVLTTTKAPVTTLVGFPSNVNLTLSFFLRPFQNTLSH